MKNNPSDECEAAHQQSSGRKNEKIPPDECEVPHQQSSAPKNEK
jgi:hypothetical protein